MDPRSLLAPRSALFMPASNARAIEKARELAADMIILDLEDSVKAENKTEAREAAVAAAAAGFGDRICAIRLNAVGTEWHRADALAVAACAADIAVLPKVQAPSMAAAAAEAIGKPLLAMIETPNGVLNAERIAAADGVYGLIAGVNDLSNELRLPPGAGRTGLSLALQTIVLAARAANCWALDGVFNDLEDAPGLAAECREGRNFGFDGKTLIHPSQIETANRIWSPSATDIEDARALIEAASGGAERFRGRMIETMHVEMAKRLLARAR